MRVKLFFLLGIIFFISCTSSSTSPKDVLGKKKMQEVLWDVIQAEVYTNQFIKKDSSTNIVEENIKLQKQVFTIHQVTKEDFYNSYRYYQNHPAEMRSLLDSIEVKKQRAERTDHFKPVKKM